MSGFKYAVVNGIPIENFLYYFSHVLFAIVKTPWRSEKHTEKEGNAGA